MIFSETLNFMLLFGDSEVYSGGNAGGSLTGPGAHSSTLWEALLPPVISLLWEGHTLLYVRRLETEKK